MSEAPADAFTRDSKESMAQISSTIAVVTTMTHAAPRGTTASTVISLSVNPPMTAASPDSASELPARIQVSSRFAVNVHSHDQPAITRAFTRKDSGKFAGERLLLAAVRGAAGTGEEERVP